MSKMAEWFVNICFLVAQFSKGATSTWYTYQPKVPKELVDKD